MRMTRSALAFAGLVALATFACNTPPAPRAPFKEEQFVLSEDARDGGDDSSSGDRVVFPEPDSGNAFHGYWRVSDEEAERADAGVADYLRGERPELADKLGGYYGQIFGILDESGRKVIHFNFLCKRSIDEMKPSAPPNPDLAAMSDWQHHVVIVHDGGDCYFQLDFDPETGAYEHLVVNGDA